MSKEAEQYITGETDRRDPVRRTLMLIAVDVKRMGEASGLEDEAARIVRNLENACDALMVI